MALCDPLAPRLRGGHCLGRPECCITAAIVQTRASLHHAPVHPPPKKTINPFFLNPLMLLTLLSPPALLFLMKKYMTSINIYLLDGFSMYLMPMRAAPECPPCQSDTLPLVPEDDEVGWGPSRDVSVLSKVNRLFKKLLVRSKGPARTSSQVFLPFPTLY
ncbi:hypothetical protein VP01_881g5 [Puccinia sorghi]|uniref:Uncharacterized protein n=1 Tax=Puccinia sorghi TaxID=27349 RepID=A0A0L6U927_9BASI|nr:hypothetical protein VP01_881g5 [Puccinia sorghi]